MQDTGPKRVEEWYITTSDGSRVKVEEGQRLTPVQARMLEAGVRNPNRVNEWVPDPCNPTTPIRL